MRKLRFLVAVIAAASAFGAIPALAGGPAYGMWTYTGSGRSWSGTYVNSTATTKGFAIGTKALKGNPVTSFTIAGTKCTLYAAHGSAYCIVKVPKKKKVRWTLHVKKPLASSQLINPCITVNAANYTCRL